MNPQFADKDALGQVNYNKDATIASLKAEVERLIAENEAWKHDSNEWPTMAEFSNLQDDNAALKEEVKRLKNSDALTADHMDGYHMGKAEAKEMLRKLDAHVEELEAERRRDALDGQSAMDEANNRVTDLERELAECMAKVEKVREWRTSVWDYNPKGKDVCIEVDYEDWIALMQILGEK